MAVATVAPPMLILRRLLSTRAPRRAPPRPDSKVVEAEKKATRQQGALCIKVVDAADFEGSVLSRSVMSAIMSDKPIILAINKSDRMPRMSDGDVKFLRSRFGSRIRDNHILGVHAVSAHTGGGMFGLAQHVRELNSEHVVVFGSAGVGKSALVRALSGSIQALELSEVNEPADIEAAGAVLLNGPGSASLDDPILCFGDGTPSRALWDTPGIPNERAFAACLPEALSAPLLARATTRDRVRHPKNMFVKAGESLVVSLTDQYDKVARIALPPLPIARVDVVDVTTPEGHVKSKAAPAPAASPAQAIHEDSAAVDSTAADTAVTERKGNPFFDTPKLIVASYLAPSVSVSVVPTESAPTELRATRMLAVSEGASGADVDGVEGKLFDQPFTVPFAPHRHGGDARGRASADGAASEPAAAKLTAGFYPFLKGCGIDLAFAGIGHIGFYHRAPFSLNAHAVERAALTTRKPMYPRALNMANHLSDRDMEAGLASGALLEGRVVQRRPGVARVVGCGPDELASVMLRGMHAQNRALHGDRVAIRLLPKALWVQPGDEETEDKETDEPIDEFGAVAGIADEAGDAAADAEDPLAPNWNFLEAASGEKSGEKRRRACADVVGIIQRSPRPFVGVLDPRTAGRQDQYIWPRRQVMPRVRIPRSEYGALESDTLYSVKVRTWLTKDRFPTGTLERAIGPVGDTPSESEAILVEAGVDRHTPFSEDAVGALPAAGWVPDDEEVARRMDLREGMVGEAVCSVDPPNCVDIDDALHAIELARAADGGRRFQVGVHIADVGHFVSAGGALDTESSERGTTFYLVDQRVNMVPDVLGENVASLHEGRDRLAFSVLWEVDESATILSTRLEKTLIRSRASLSYKEAQMRLDAAAADAAATAVPGTLGAYEGDDPLTRSLSILGGVARKLSAERIAAGALRLASPEVKFELGATDQGGGSSDEVGCGDAAAAAAANPSGSPRDMGLYMPLESNSMVEEFMLLANVSVAKIVKEHFPRSALLRRHPHPQAADFGQLHDKLSAHGLGLDLTSPTALAASLDACTKRDEPYFALLTRYMAVRCMPPAEYVCAGETESLGENHHHFGLAAPIYSHFTSPIRRYAPTCLLSDLPPPSFPPPVRPSARPTCAPPPTSVSMCRLPPRADPTPCPVCWCISGTPTKWSTAWPRRPSVGRRRVRPSMTRRASLSSRAGSMSATPPQRRPSARRLRCTHSYTSRIVRLSRRATRRSSRPAGCRCSCRGTALKAGASRARATARRRRCDTARTRKRSPPRASPSDRWTRSLCG